MWESFLFNTENTPFRCDFAIGNTFYFQAPANHLISASVMSAPAALAMSKLFYPETKKSKTTAKDVDCMEKRWRFSKYC